MSTHRMSHSQISETMGRLPTFSELSRETLMKLASGTRQIYLPKDGDLFVKGDAAEAAYVLVSGQIKVYLPLADGVDKVLSMVAPGDCIGIASAYLGTAHPACAVSKVDCHLLEISHDVLRQQAAQDARLACRLLDTVSRRVVGLIHDLQSCTPRSSLQRVGCYLLQQRPQDAHGSYEFVLPTSKRDIAAKLNLAQETLSRTLHQLIEHNIIEVNGRLIRVLDSARLAAINLLGCPPQPH